MLHVRFLKGIFDAIKCISFHTSLSLIHCGWENVMASRNFETPLFFWVTHTVNIWSSLLLGMCFWWWRRACYWLVVLFLFSLNSKIYSPPYCSAYFTCSLETGHLAWVSVILISKYQRRSAFSSATFFQQLDDAKGQIFYWLRDVLCYFVCFIK